MKRTLSAASALKASLVASDICSAPYSVTPRSAYRRAIGSHSFTSGTSGLRARFDMADGRPLRFEGQNTTVKERCVAESNSTARLRWDKGIPNWRASRS